MAFTPKSEQNKPQGNFESTANQPAPKEGARKARVSMIVDLGTQVRPDIWKDASGKIVDEGTEGATSFPQKPCQQVAVYVDLVADTVDYGGDIGKAHYRLQLNDQFQGDLKGINFAKTPPKDIKGNTIEGKPWAMHPQNKLTKLAIACGREDVVESAEIDQLLNEQLMVDVEVKRKDSGKEDKDGNPIVYVNVKGKTFSKVPPVSTGETDENGDDIEAVPTFPALKTAAKCITFDTATKEDIKFLRVAVVKAIKASSDYEGSKIKEAIEAYEAENGPIGGAQKEGKGAAKPKLKDKAPLKQPEAKPAPNFSDMDDDIPF